MMPKVKRELRRRPAVESKAQHRHGAATMFGPSRAPLPTPSSPPPATTSPSRFIRWLTILLRHIVIALLQRFNPFQSEILCARLQRDDPNLVVLRVVAANPAQKLEPASPDDLKARLKVTCFARCSPRTRRSSSDEYGLRTALTLYKSE